MKKSFSLVLFLALFIAACGSDSTASSGTEQQTENVEQTTDKAIDEEPSLSAPDCVVMGQVLEGNTFWMADLDILAVIKADESTTKEGFEPSHRILELLDGRSCEVKFKEELPENTSPDYPYYIAQIQYNNASHLVGIKGYYDVFICDLDNENKISKLSPEFMTKRAYDDPQSGMIQRIELWENYLLGYAQDVGTFAFDLSDKAAPKAVTAFAEWQDKSNGRYHSLFMLPTEGGQQAIIPFYDSEADNFELHPIFNQAEDVSLNIAKSARNNQFLVLRSATDETKAFGVDLKSRTQVSLPAEVSNMKTQDIIKWMAKRK